MDDGLIKASAVRQNKKGSTITFRVGGEVDEGRKKCR